MCFAGAVVASWSITQGLTVWQVQAPFTVVTNIFVTEFSETFRKNFNRSFSDYGRQSQRERRFFPNAKFKTINDFVFSYIGRHNNCHFDENWSHNLRPLGAIQGRMRTKIKQRVHGWFALHSPNIPFVLFPSDHWYEELTSYCPISSDWEALCSNRSTIAYGYGAVCFAGSRLRQFKYQYQKNVWSILCPRFHLKCKITILKKSNKVTIGVTKNNTNIKHILLKQENIYLFC